MEWRSVYHRGRFLTTGKFMPSLYPAPARLFENTDNIAPPTDFHLLFASSGVKISLSHAFAGAMVMLPGREGSSQQERGIQIKGHA